MSRTLGTKRHKALIAFVIEKRKEANMNQTDLAEALSVYQSQIARMESGQRRIDVVEILELAEIMKFDATDLLKKLLKIEE